MRLWGQDLADPAAPDRPPASSQTITAGPFKLDLPGTSPTVLNSLTASAVITNWNKLPPPDMVVGYGKAVENGAERLFRQFEIEAEHRRSLESGRLNLQGQQLGFIRDERRRAQWLAGSYAFGALVVAVIALALGHPTAAGFIGTTSIATVVAAFLAPATRAVAKQVRARLPSNQPPAKSVEQSAQQAQSMPVAPEA